MLTVNNVIITALPKTEHNLYGANWISFQLKGCDEELWVYELFNLNSRICLYVYNSILKYPIAESIDCK